MWAWPARRSGSARSRRRQLPRPGSDPRCRAQPPVPTRCTPATGSSPSMPGSPTRSRPRAWRSSARRPSRSAASAPRTPARALAAAAGVPLLPGSEAIVDAADAVEQAERVGFPLLVKSVAGGGGIGMLVCRDAAELPAVVERAMRQSEQAFGSSAVFLERLVRRARHVEVQAFGDGNGGLVVLGDRDCSTQRRRQKVVEETPAPNLDDELRAALFDATRRLLEPIRYRSAGTVEFVVDAESGGFAFLEVNTRLQVEHAVTEAVTGVDLVEWMVRLAAGDADGMRRYVHAPTGHSIEVRVYAEDPVRDFRPSAGVVTEAQLARGRARRHVGAHRHRGQPVLRPAARQARRARGRPRAARSTRWATRSTRRASRGSRPIAGTSGRSSRRPVFVDGSGRHRSAGRAPVLAPHDRGPRRRAASRPCRPIPAASGYWHVGVPPSGPMDERSFALGNEILGNPSTAAGPGVHRDRTRRCASIPPRSSASPART